MARIERYKEIITTPCATLHCVGTYFPLDFINKLKNTFSSSELIKLLDNAGFRVTAQDINMDTLIVEKKFPWGTHTEEHTGGSTSYYKVAIAYPDTEGVKPYVAECTDIIEALGMDFAEANIFKEIWRTAAARTLGKKKRGHDEIYGAEKVLYFAQRRLKKLQRTEGPQNEVTK